MKYGLVISAAALLAAVPAAAQERVWLQEGFTPDPYAVALSAGGPRENEGELGDDCIGWTTEESTVRLTYSAGSAPLFISVRSDRDTTLIVRDPRGRYSCNDDQVDLDPGVAFEQPLSGTYEIWIGAYDEDENGPATLILSEVRPDDWENLPENEPDDEPQDEPADDGTPYVD